MAQRLPQIQLDVFKPLRELVTDNIRQAIINGDFPPGMRLMELQLAADLGVSRTPIREAIRKLELEGLIVMIPRRGAYVANFSIKDINEVYEIRTALDVLSAGLAAERINEEELEEMERRLISMRPAIDAMDIPKIAEEDSAFHDVIYKASRNERLISIISNLREQINSIRSKSMLYPGRLTDMMEEHRAIVDAIAQGNPEAAEKAVQTHMENAERTLLKVIEEKSMEDGANNIQEESKKEAKKETKKAAK